MILGRVLFCQPCIESLVTLQHSYLQTTGVVMKQLKFEYLHCVAMRRLNELPDRKAPRRLAKAFLTL